MDRLSPSRAGDPESGPQTTAGSWPAIRPFDNRPSNGLARIAAGLGLLYSRRGERHLAFHANGRSIVYAYIRKNACSAFKAMICGESPARARLKEFGDPMKFLGRFHAVRSMRQMPE